MTEEWRSILGFEGLYSVSSLGRVMSLGRVVARGAGTQKINERVLRPGLDGQGYRMVVMRRNGIGHTCRIASLVAQAFLGPRPSGREIAHGDGDKLNNAATNLRYATHAENLADKLIHGTDNRGAKHGMSVLTEDEVREIKRLRGQMTGKEIAQKFRISQQAVCDIHKGRRWAHLQVEEAIGDAAL